MTVDTSPEAIAALLDGVTPGPWRVEYDTTLIWGNCDPDDASARGMGYPVVECRVTPVSLWASGPYADAGSANARFIAAARELVPALAAAITALTAERDALNKELREARMEAIADGVQFQLDMEDRAAERDEARALLAILYGEEGMGNVTPTDATAALARRDAAMRNDGRKSVKVKPLVWEEYAPSCFFGRGEFGDYSIAPSASAYHEGEIRISGLDGGFAYATAIEAAKAAAQADYEARILAALEPEGGE